MSIPNIRALERQPIHPGEIQFFSMSAEFWLNLQRNVYLWGAAQGLKGELANIHPIQVA